jgi:hypothetical protein
VERKGMTLVPLSIYFNSKGRAKVELALAKGKNNADKRNTIKERDWKRSGADHAGTQLSVAIISLSNWARTHFPTREKLERTAGSPFRASGSET